MDPKGIVHVMLAQGTTESAALPSMDYGFWATVLNAGVPEKLIMLVLMGFSLVSWAVIAYKWRALRRATAESEAFLEQFWSSKRLDTVFQKSDHYANSPVAQVFRAGYIELAKIRRKDGESSAPVAASGGDTQLGDLESVERSMRRGIATQLTQLEASVPFLATAGSTSPFIGLLGTVIGIMSSFQDIGRVGNATLATVAPGIGGALVATAFGLFSAIPAVIAYNTFLSRIRVLETEMQNFSADFLNIIKRHFF